MFRLFDLLRQRHRRGDSRTVADTEGRASKRAAPGAIGVCRTRAGSHARPEAFTPRWPRSAQACRCLLAWPLLLPDSRIGVRGFGTARAKRRTTHADVLPDMDSFATTLARGCRGACSDWGGRTARIGCVDITERPACVFIQFYTPSFVQDGKRFNEHCEVGDGNYRA